MAKGANMKVNMTADNSDLVRKSKESKQALKDFEKVGDDALSRLGEAFGVNTGKIEQMSSALRGLGTKMSESGNAGTAAFGKLLTSVSGLSTAIAGISIGAVVAGFKMLNDEAENFKNTVAGANMEMATAAYIDTYRQVIHDFNREIGQGTAEAQSSWKKFWGTIGAGMRAAFQTGAVAGAAAPGDFNNQALVTYNNLLTEAGQKARTAEEISNEMYQVTRQMSDKTVEWARMERQIAEYKRIAYDKTSSTAQQQEALNKAVELITQKYGEQAELQGKLADLQEEFNSLAESSVADIDKANQLRVQSENVTASMNNALRELSERQASVAANAKKEAEARQASLEAMQKMVAEQKALKDWGAISEGNTLKDSLPGQLAAPDAGIAVPVTPVLDMDAVRDISKEMQLILISAFESIGSALGGLIGDLITGEDAWGNFGNAALSAFGDMATSIGKMAISIGVAALAIQGSLTTLNGWAAIAAGTALVALGMAVKTGLSNIASGNYSASASVATSGNYGSSTSALATSFDEREVNVKVTGKLYGSGNQLIAVIENENNRKNHTT